MPLTPPLGSIPLPLMVSCIPSSFGNGERYFFCLFHNAISFTCTAGLVIIVPSPLQAGKDCCFASVPGTLRNAGEHTCSVAGRTGFLSDSLTAPSAAFATSNQLIDLDSFVYTMCNLLKRKLHTNPDIRPATYPAACTCPASKRTAKRTSPKRSAKNIPKPGKDIIHGKSAKTSCTTGPHAINSGMSKLVVSGFFCSIAQHIVRFCRFFKFIFCSLVSGFLSGWYCSAFCGMLFNRPQMHFYLRQVPHNNLFCHGVLYSPTTTLANLITFPFNVYPSRTTSTIFPFFFFLEPLFLLRRNENPYPTLFLLPQ